MMRAWLMIVLLALTPAAADAQPPMSVPLLPTESPPHVVELTIEGAVQRALDRNLDIAAERLSPQVFDFSLAALRATYKPTFTTAFGRRSQVQLPTSQLDGGTRVTTGTLTSNSSASQNLPWGGGSLTLSFNNLRQDTSNVFATRNPQYQSTLTATLVQPLLQGFRTDETRARLKITELSQANAETAFTATTASTLASVRKAYWDLVYANQVVDVARKSVDLATRLIADNNARVAIGTLALIEVVQAEAEAASRRQTLTQAEAAAQAAELALKRLIVHGTEDELWTARLSPVDRPMAALVPIDVSAATQRALANRADLISVRRDLDASRASLDLQRDQTLPTVNLVASYGLQGLGGTEVIRSGLGSEVIRTVASGYLDALSTLGSVRYPSWSVSLNVSIPIGGTAAQANAARTQLQLQQAQAQLKARELQVATEVANAGLAVTSNQRRIEAAQAARELAARRLDAEMTKFGLGSSTNYQVVQAQRDLADAENAELRALLDYQKSFVDFERVQVTSAS